MQIIDAHHHLWDLSACSYPWLQSGNPDGGFLGDISSLQKTYAVSDYRLDIGDLNVVKSVHVQAEHDPADPVAETRWLQAQADAPGGSGFPHAIVAFADFSDDKVANILARHADYRNVRGIRQILSHHWIPEFSHAPVEYLKDDQWRKRISLLRNHDFSFDLQIYPHQVRDALPMIDAHPNTQFIVNHALEPWSSTEDVLSMWHESVAELARRDNTSIKISGFGMFLRPLNAPAVEPFVLAIIEAFGVDRCMFASNFPVDKLFCSYLDTFRTLDAITRSFSAKEREAVFSNTARRIYRL